MFHIFTDIKHFSLLQKLFLRHIILKTSSIGWPWKEVSVPLKTIIPFLKVKNLLQELTSVKGRLKY